MMIYLMRHAQYDPLTGHLSEEGIENVKFLKSLLDQEGISFDLVLTSPKDRAKETALLLSGDLKPKEMLELSPSSDYRKAIPLIPRDLSVLVVSHNPLLVGMATALGGESI